MSVECHFSNEMLCCRSPLLGAIVIHKVVDLAGATTGHQVAKLTLPLQFRPRVHHIEGNRVCFGSEIGTIGVWDFVRNRAVRWRTQSTSATNLVRASFQTALLTYLRRFSPYFQETASFIATLVPADTSIRCRLSSVSQMAPSTVPSSNLSLRSTKRLQDRHLSAHLHAAMQPISTGGGNASTTSEGSTGRSSDSMLWTSRRLSRRRRGGFRT